MRRTSQTPTTGQRIEDMGAMVGQVIIMAIVLTLGATLAIACGLVMVALVPTLPMGAQLTLAALSLWALCAFVRTMRAI